MGCETLDANRILASAVRFLIDGHDEDIARLLLSCSVEFSESGESSYAGASVVYGMNIILSGPRAVYDVISKPHNPVLRKMEEAFAAVFPSDNDYYINRIFAHVELLDIDPHWRAELLEIARGEGVTNQGVDTGRALRVWNNLRFRSESEVRIAMALDRAGVLFFPNCKGRLSSGKQRLNREADFLVCQGGKWGILEVDGEPFHPPTRTVEDHERDRLFRSYGVRVVEHFDASECYQKSDEVVRQFLQILGRS